MMLFRFLTKRAILIAGTSAVVLYRPTQSRMALSPSLLPHSISGSEFSTDALIILKKQYHLTFGTDNCPVQALLFHRLSS